MNKKKILALSPHTDDIELGCGGTLARLSRQNSDIKVLVFSQTMNKPEITDEFKESMKILKIKHEIFNFPIRDFPENRQAILEILYLESLKDYDLVFCPSSFDTHQDHEVIRQEAFRAFKTTSMLGYKLDWNNREFRKDMFVELNTSDVLFKNKMLDCYKSQSFRPYFQNEYSYKNAMMTGVQIKKEFAEAFEVIRWIF